VIEVRDLWKSFGATPVLKGISLDIRRGETYVVLGGSGSGKTVLMKHVIGLLKPDRGTVRVDGTEISSLTGKALTEARAVFGMVFQWAALFDSMTVYENVAFPLDQRGHAPPEEEVREKVLAKLKVVDLGEEVLGRYPAELSDPKVVLYDEPTTGLDPITTDYVDEMILAAKKKLGITSMVISHDIASAFNVADRLAVLYDGHLAAEGTPAEVKASPDPYVQRFLSTWFQKQ
jgi:phospholipid/cholesterol/gamma-HCH transport system ATP-binding protein